MSKSHDDAEDYYRHRDPLEREIDHAREDQEAEAERADRFQGGAYEDTNDG